MTTDYTRHLSFIQTLVYLDEAGQTHLLRLEQPSELAALFDVAMTEGYTDVAASIEVRANRRGEY